jgi:uncharacterized Zn finger protein (UPF0148 family)
MGRLPLEVVMDESEWTGKCPRCGCVVRHHGDHLCSACVTLGVVVNDNGELIELPPVTRDRAHEQHLRDLERQARHAQRVRDRARYVLGRLTKPLVRDLQDPEVRAVFLELLEEADGIDHRRTS